MITTLELTQLISETTESFSGIIKKITILTGIKYKTKEEYDKKSKELRRLKSLKKKTAEQLQTLKLVLMYLESGIQMEGIKEQRNILLVKLAGIKDKEDLEGINRAHTDPENKKRISSFDTKYRTKHLRSQLKVLNFILK
jgi:hypothetical protein